MATNNSLTSVANDLRLIMLMKKNQNRLKQACAAEIAVLYAALRCKQNKRYRTSARL